MSFSETKMVVGLGNPGRKYEGSRHNVGFDVLNLLTKQRALPAPRSKFDGQFTKLVTGDDSLLLVWPLTYMNQSGRCVRAISDFFKIDTAKNLLVVCDDLSLPVGKLRMRGQGSAGGQKGLSDILRALATQDVPRLRIGIDRPPPNWQTADYVLGKFEKNEQPIMDVSIQEAATTVIEWCQHGIQFCMNRVN